MTPPTRSERLLLPLALATMLWTLVAGGSGREINLALVFFGSLPLLYAVLRSKPQGETAWTLKLALVLLALAALQLVPLPPSLWTALPGRDLAAQALVASGQEPGWRPLALDPAAAAVSLLAVVPALTMHAAVLRLEPRKVKRLLALVALFAIASAIVGIAQRLIGGGALYATEHAGTALGLFANRNHHADLLVAGILLTVTIPLGRTGKSARAIATAAVVLLAFAVVATTSRAGIALAIPAIIAALVAIWRPGRRAAPLLGAGLVAGGIAMLLVPAFSDIFARFGLAADDQRLTMATDTLAATRAMWPWGSGYGSFVPVYMAHENLDMIDARFVVAAHNDYLQLALEGGLPGVLTALAGPLALALLAWQMLSRRAPMAAWAAWGVGAVLLAHSALDFPLRTPALAMLFGLCTAAAQMGIAQMRKARL